MTLRLGSLCSGYEGLGMGIAEVLDVELAWVADNEPAAASLLAHHWPAVPNLGDITKVTWQDVVRVDIVAAGFPCTDLSYAGLGEGIQKGNRSGLWYFIADALGVLRPRVVVLENVAAIVSRRPGLDVVLADLAALGFDAWWTCVRASDVGAPHARDRWFLVAHAQDQRHERGGLAWGRRPGPEDGRFAAADTERLGRKGQRGDSGPLSERSAPAALGCRSTGGGEAAADTDRGGLEGIPERDSSAGARLEAPCGNNSDGRVLDWGRYGPAIDRWERVFGRPAPVPRLPIGRGGADKLNPAFVEWMQGLPAGHVTAVPGLTPNEQIKLGGNGVVPAQAAHALRLLLPAVFAAMERKDVPA